MTSVILSEGSRGFVREPQPKDPEEVRITHTLDLFSTTALIAATIASPASPAEHPQGDPMKLRPFYTALALACSLTLAAQTSKPSTPHKPFQPATEQAPGAAPDKVWLNLTTRVYHCPGDRYYGRTKDGKYMTESEAKASGAHGPRGATCFK